MRWFRDTFFSCSEDEFCCSIVPPADSTELNYPVVSISASQSSCWDHGDVQGGRSWELALSALSTRAFQTGMHRDAEPAWWEQLCSRWDVFQLLCHPQQPPPLVLFCCFCWSFALCCCLRLPGGLLLGRREDWIIFELKFEMQLSVRVNCTCTSESRTGSSWWVTWTSFNSLCPWTPQPCVL